VARTTCASICLALNVRIVVIAVTKWYIFAPDFELEEAVDSCWHLVNRKRGSKEWKVLSTEEYMINSRVPHLVATVASWLREVGGCVSKAPNVDVNSRIKPPTGRLVG
jgi:hypothetical protein